MRRQGNFGDSPANAYEGGQIQNTHSDFQGQLEAFTPERDQPYSDAQWKWERDAPPPNISRPMATTTPAIYNEGQGVDSSTTYYHHGGQTDPISVMEKQGSHPRAQPQHQENPSFEQKFMDDMTRLAKDQIEAEDAEIVRHRETINTINTRYEEQLAALRARHTCKREEIMRKESQARQQQYKQQTAGMMMDQYHPNAANLIPSGHPQGYIGNAQDPADAPSRSYGSDRFEAYGERARFQGGARDHGFDSRSQYPGGTVASRFY